MSEIGAGKEFTCGVMADGTVACWGRGAERELEPPERKGFVTISSGDQHTCAVRFDGVVVCWGGNHYLGATNPPDYLEKARY